MRCHFSSSALLETTGWHYHINRPVRGHHHLSHHPHKSTEDKLCKSLYTMGKKTTLTERYGPPNHLQWRWGFRLKWRTCIKWADWIWHLINSAIIKEEKEHRLNVRAEKYSGWSLWLFNELARYKGGSSQDISTYFLWQLSIHGNRLKVLDYPSIHPSIIIRQLFRKLDSDWLHMTFLKCQKFSNGLTLFHLDLCLDHHPAERVF